RAIGSDLLTCSGRVPPSTLTRLPSAPHPRSALGAPPVPEPWPDRRVRGPAGHPARAPGAERRPAVQARPARLGLAAPRLPPPPHGGPLPRGRAADRAAPGARAVVDAGADLRLHPARRLAAPQGREASVTAHAEDPPRRAGRHALPGRDADHRPARVPHRS